MDTVAGGPLVAIVNDNRQFLNLLTILLEDEGFRTARCTQAREALELITRSRPALVVLDIRMEADDSGWKVLEELRASPETAALPVIVCSALANIAHDWPELAADPRCRILSHPFEVDQLLGAARELLGLQPEEPASRRV